MSLESISAILAGASLAATLAVLLFGWQILQSTRRSERAGDERLEILREQQERLEILHQERSVLKDELERLRSALGEEERLLALPVAAVPEQSELRQRRAWWRRIFGIADT